MFAPTGGPRAAEAYDYLRRVWLACGDQFGMWRPIEGLGLPRHPPERHRPAAGEIDAYLAAHRHDGAGVFQGLLRRAHDVLCMSVVLAPPLETMPTWVDLRHRWARISEPVPDELLGMAEIYQARLADPEPTHVEPTRALSTACRMLLPAPTPRAEFDGMGVVTASGFAVWEAERDDDARARRRIVVIAPRDRDEELSAWTWTRGDAAITPFARYLKHAAKLRYHLRVWAGGETLRELRERTDRAAGPVTELIDKRRAADSGDFRPRPEDTRLLVDQLRAETYHLAAAMTRVRELRYSVEIAAHNLGQYVPLTVPGTADGRGLFADDRGLAIWFVQQLDDDLRYADQAAQRGRLALDGATALIGPLAARRPDKDQAAREGRPEGRFRVPGQPRAAVAPTPRRPATTRAPGPPRVLALADEWLPGRGGLSALNRYLCAALAEAGVEVYCVVPASTAEERADAERVAVRLLDAPAVPGTGERDLLMRRPPLPAGVLPDLVIGHGRITGPHAKAVTEDHFPAARRLHVVHTSPDETDWWRPDLGVDTGARAESRTTEQLVLSRDAAMVLAVGPRLHQWIHRELSVFDDAPEPVRLDPGFDYADQAPRRPPPGRPQVLVLGRLEDASVKGLDIAARAVGYTDRLRGPTDPQVELLLRGAPPGQAQEIRDQVLRWSGRSSLAVTVRNYSPESERLQRDLRRASLLLMPSRAEGFGLVGLEGIVAGTPTLVSDRSGIGELLREVLPRADADQIVVPVENAETDAAAWGRLVHDILRDRQTAFARAESVRRAMRERRTWSAAIAHLLTALGLP